MGSLLSAIERSSPLSVVVPNFFDNVTASLSLFHVSTSCPDGFHDDLKISPLVSRLLFLRARSTRFPPLRVTTCPPLPAPRIRS